jgi:hypothetical protein
MSSDALRSVEERQVGSPRQRIGDPVAHHRGSTGQRTQEAIEGFRAIDRPERRDGRHPHIDGRID